MPAVSPATRLRVRSAVGPAIKQLIDDRLPAAAIAEVLGCTETSVWRVYDAHRADQRCGCGRPETHT